MRDAQAAPPVECGDGSRPRRRGSGAGGHARGAVWLRPVARLSPRAPGRAVWPRGRPAPLPRVWGMHSASHRRLPERPSRGPVSAPPLPPPFPPDAPAGLRAAGTVRILQARARSPGPVAQGQHVEGGAGTRGLRVVPKSFASCLAQSPLCKRSSGVRPRVPGAPGLWGTVTQGHAGRVATGRGSTDEVVCGGRWTESTVPGDGAAPGSGEWRVSSGAVLS